MFDSQVDRMGVAETLDAVESWHAEQVEREIATFVAAAHYADLHHRDSRPRDQRPLPGTERARRLGGPGTPVVWEFAAAQFGTRIGKSAYVGRSWIADALDVRHRLPRLWARVRGGQVPVGYARHVATQTRELSVHAAGWVDAEVAEYADGRLCWSRFEALVAGKVIDADPDAAAASERAAAREQFARLGRSSEHGHKTLYVKSTAAAMIRIDATIAYLADALGSLGDDDAEDTRRAKAVLIMANPTQALQLLAAFARNRRGHSGTDPAPTDPAPTDPGEPAEDQPPLTDITDTDTTDTGSGSGSVETPDDTDRAAGFYAPFRPADTAELDRFRFGFDPRDLLPQVTLYLHLFDHHRDAAAHADAAGVVRWEGLGPISTAYLRDVLGPAAHFTVKPVLDLAGQAPVDAYEIPDRHREAVHLRTPADVFPFAAATTTRDGRRRRHLDHTRRYTPPDHGGPPGQTNPANLGPMTGFHHRLKTHGGWQLTQPFDGIYLWRDPHGHTYLVDHTGTRPLGHSPPADTDTPDITIEVYPAPHDPAIEYVGHHAA